MSDKPKHSAAPWIASGVRITIQREKFLQIVNADGFVIALVSYSDATYKHHTQSHADQRAMATAPELLALLKRYRNAYPAFRMKPVGAPGSEKRIEQEMLTALEEAADTAIAKAGG